MASESVTQSYSYVKPSALSTEVGSNHLALSTSGGVTEKHGVVREKPPHFFQGALTNPVITARCLTTLSRVVAARYTMTAQQMQMMKDPVVTSGGGQLRFEAFSGCGGVYGRLDLTPEVYDGLVCDQGTTNVDFNAPMRQALARIRDREAVSLSVGDDEVALTKGTEQTVEQKVKLPKRWIKGFTEVQSYLARMKPQYELSKIAAIRFLRSLPRGVRGSTPIYVSDQGKHLRFTATPGASNFAIRGVERLKLLDELVPLVKSVRIYAETNGETSTWELDFGGQYFSLTLSPENQRGFSGEGQALQSLAAGISEDALAQAQDCLCWQAALKAEDFTNQQGLTRDQLESALNALGSRGLVGFDNHRDAYFHRVLPFDLSAVDRMHPRLVAAKKLVNEGAVRRVSSLDDPWVIAEVPGTDVTHRVQQLDEGRWRCTCQWYTKYQGKRGMCKHILATQMQYERTPGG